MGLRINNSISAQFARRQTNQTTNRLLQNFQQLSSGLRINRAADDAAGLAIAERFRAQVAQANQEINNLQSGVNYVQTAEGALGTQQDGLQRARELAVQAANGTLNDGQRTALNDELQQILEDVNTTAANTEFNGQRPLDGSQTTIPLGTDGNEITVQESTTNALGVAGLDISTQAGAQGAIDALSTAIDNVIAQRASLGAQQNRFESAIAQREISSQNQAAAESAIRDADIARVTIDQVRNSILQQSGVAGILQGNISTQSALQLLGG